VAHTVALDLLDRVGQRVPVVEHLARPGLAQVGRDDLGFDPRRPLNQLGQHRSGRIEGRRRVDLDQIEDARIGDEAALDHLGQAGGEVGRWQRLQCGQVGDHGRRWMERADEVLTGRGVHTGLATDGGIDHAEQRGRHGQPGHSPQPAGGDEAGEVGHRTAADPDDRVGAGEAGGAQRVEAAGRDPQRLGRLGIGYRQRMRRPAGPAQGGDDPFGDRRQGQRVDHGDLGHPGEHGGHQVEHVPADQHGVGTLAADVYAGHGHRRRAYGVASWRPAPVAGRLEPERGEARRPFGGVDERVRGPGRGGQPSGAAGLL
jgi:hypothetical protein